VTEEVVKIDVVPKKVRFELVREVAGQTNPVVIKSKMMPKTQEVMLFPRLKPLPRAYFVTNFIKREQTIKGLFGNKVLVDYLIRCNQYWSESLDSLSSHIPKFSRELENLLLADDVIQHRDSIAAAQKFVIDEQFIKVMALVFLISLPFGIFMNEILHLIPSQVVTWLP
jgi:hypothetical protein